MDQILFEKLKRRDKIARSIIISVGIFIIISVIGILFLITSVALPLFLPPHQQIKQQFSVENEFSGRIFVIGIDEYTEQAYALDQNGLWGFYDIEENKLRGTIPREPESGTNTILSVETYGNNIYTLLWADGTVTVEKVDFPITYENNKRVSDFRVTQLQEFAPIDEGKPIRVFVRKTGEEEDEKWTIVRLFQGRILVNTQSQSENFLGEVETEELSGEIEDNKIWDIASMALTTDGNVLYAGTNDGFLLRWDIADPEEITLTDQVLAFPDGRSITALGMVYGDVSLAVGDANGNLSTWMRASGSNQNMKKLVKVHQLGKHDTEVIGIEPVLLNKSIISWDQSGVVRLDHMTSESHLLTFQTKTPLLSARFNSRGDGLIAIDTNKQVTVWDVKNPHPEISWNVLFGRVWYEGYSKLEFIWQSSSASDDFESKISLVPLIFGSLKGTLYAMIFAIPLAILGAIYTSQFAKDTFRKWIKPGVEIMAAMPSVIIGFLVALWLAPIMERYIVGFLTCLVMIPLVGSLFILVWKKIREQDWGKRIENGYEFLAIFPILILGVVLSIWMQPMIEAIFFDGNFKQWLFESAGEQYNQRNSIIIAFGLGFLVIPIIFTISDDALTNVPSNLKAASLALGASRWQTVWRVVIPSASPGIFAAIIIGFGRAVGETMVVLMATGNTPLLDWSPFNGMRTLSANIAVELPEAPVEGTLYRVLFLSAVVLFIMTFVLNIIAEIVRTNLRKKYGY